MKNSKIFFILTLTIGLSLLSLSVKAQSWDCSPDGFENTCRAILNEEGVLTISGSGAMGDYTSQTMPWIISPVSFNLFNRR